jgi:multidrug resistance efflux pump
MGSKSAFDTIASSYDSVKNTYNTQLETSNINMNNFENTTTKSTALQFENQKASLELTQRTLSTQLTSADDSKAIQLASLKNQVLTLKQNIAVLSNSLDGEVLYAGVNGVVKARVVGQDNKVSPNTMLCQILPKDAGSLSLQIFSYQPLSL